MSPSAQRCAYACILRETEIPEPLTELNVLQVGCNFGDGIDIDRGSDAGRGRSVTNRPVAQPPTKTSSFSSGRNNRAAESRSCRLVSPMDCRPKTTDHHLLGQFAFARTPVPEGVGQGQQFIEGRIAEGSLGRLLV